MLLYSLVVVVVLASELSTPDYTTWYVAALEFDSGKSQFYLKGQQPHFPNSYVCEYAGEFVAGIEIICVTNIRRLLCRAYALVFVSQKCYEFLYCSKFKFDGSSY